MKASDCSFDDMFKQARLNPELGQSTSFIQVEFGMTELRGHWDGFVEASDYYGIEYTSRKKVCDEFSEALRETLDLHEPSPI